MGIVTRGTGGRPPRYSRQRTSPSARRCTAPRRNGALRGSAGERFRQHHQGRPMTIQRVTATLLTAIFTVGPFTAPAQARTQTHPTALRAHAQLAAGQKEGGSGSNATPTASGTGARCWAANGTRSSGSTATASSARSATARIRARVASATRSEQSRIGRHPAPIAPEDPLTGPPNRAAAVHVTDRRCPCGPSSLLDGEDFVPAASTWPSWPVRSEADRPDCRAGAANGACPGSRPGSRVRASPAAPGGAVRRGGAGRHRPATVDGGRG